MRRTKIIATIGPACEREGVLDALVQAGIDVARLNTAHGSREQLAARLTAVRDAADRAGRHVGVMVDLAGPKLRIGDMATGVELIAGARFALVVGGGAGDAAGASVSHAQLIEDLSPGDRVLLDDGRITLEVAAVGKDRADTVVISGGPLAGRKGISVPGVRLGLQAVTEKDLEDLAWALDAGVDLVALSFVHGPDDVLRLRKAMGQRAVPIVAKIEKHEAAGAVEGIVSAADAVMVARGDLGLETSPEEVPVIQRAIVTACRAAGRPVIVATEMLESMVTASRPTRAEASDVATAVFEGADAVMLSAETAVGSHPVEAVETMARICVTSEEYGGPAMPVVEGLVAGRDDVTRAVSSAVASLASELDLAAIVTATESGATPRAVAAQRPAAPVLAITPDVRVARQLALVWGVRSEVVPAMSSLEEMAAVAGEVARATGVARPGDLIALTAGAALNSPGTTDMVRVLRV
jgi:pyruvate kinase